MFILSLQGLLAIVAPLAVGFLGGASALAGLLTGAIVSGSLLGLMMANAGGAWDNTKKYIEAGAHGGKGSRCHRVRNSSEHKPKFLKVFRFSNQKAHSTTGAHSSKGTCCNGERSCP